MKLLTQGDDFGFTRGVTLGIIDSIDKGILRNTGMFTNMPSSEFAASFIKDRPQACFGIDFNIVSGKPVADPKLIPHLVDENGEFIRSGVRTRNPEYQSEEGRRKMYPADECYIEMKAQYDRFLELVGKKPGYLHAHSIMPEPYLETILKLSEETGIPFSMKIMKDMELGQIPLQMGAKVFDPVAQLNKDTIHQVLDNQKYLLDKEVSCYICHPGYVDAELLGLTTLSLERAKDAQMYMSEEIKKWVEDNNVELITYYDLYKIKENRE
ncbi:MAG: ChbG/HpnK family deacetylase [Erysipelotrichaceae bacterium]|nr:ChbG/HpnK family deacetylase [Erysipelotrichaceae bacterium]